MQVAIYPEALCVPIEHLRQYERSDVCAVSACAIIVENVVAFEVARAFVEKFGGDSLEEMQARYKLFLDMAKQR